jgi:hypothetical protein
VTSDEGPQLVAASHDPAREGPVAVERTITWQDGLLSVAVSLAAIGDRPVQVLHREAVIGDAPPSRMAPPPLASNTQVMTYDLLLEPGERRVLEYDVPAPAPSSRADLERMLSDWIPRRDAALSAIDERDAVTPTVAD